MNPIRSPHHTYSGMQGSIVPLNSNLLLLHVTLSFLAMMQVQIFTHGYIFITNSLCLLHGRRGPTVMINKAPVNYIMQ